MPSQYTITDQKPSKKVTTITSIDAELLKKAETRVIQKLSSDLKLKGFRSGKIPESIVREQVDQAFITERSIEEAVPLVLQEIFEKNPSSMINRPEVQIENFSPLKIEVSWDVYPIATIGDYKKISVKKQKAEVTEEDLSTAISNLQKALQKTEKTEKLPEITEIVIEKITGKKLQVDAWKSSLREELKQQKEFEAKQQFEDEFYKKLIALTTVELPNSLVREEQNNILRELKQNILRYGLSYEHYLAGLKKTEEEVVKSFETQARERITLRIALETIAKLETITVSDQEIEGQLQAIQKEHPTTTLTPRILEMFKYQKMMQKTLEKIMPSV